MIRRLLFAVVMLLAPSVLLAGYDRDILLTSEGTLYTIQSDLAINHKLDTPSTRILRLTVQKDGKATSSYLPASLTGGAHSDPSLAYDAATRTLFVFWQKQPNRMSSELLVCSFAESTWSEPTSIDNDVFQLRFNLRIGTTRLVHQLEEDGTTTRIPFLMIHAVWWNQTGGGESGRYAMLSFENGRVSSIQTRELLDFVPNKGEPIEIGVGLDRDFFRHPAIFEKPTHDSVEVLFADWDTNRLHRVDIRPIRQNGVLHIPDGAARDDFGPPEHFAKGSGDKTDRISIIKSPGEGDDYAFVYEAGSKLNYLFFKRKTWSKLKTLTLSEGLSFEAGVDAVTRLLAE